LRGGTAAVLPENGSPAWENGCLIVSSCMDEKKTCGRKDWFRLVSCKAAECVGAYWAFGTAIGLILLWAATGPFFNYSDTWQLVINTGTTIVTFLMVFLIQNTQNRDAKAIHLKLDELIRSTSKARNAFVNLENLSDEDLTRLQKEFEALQKRAKFRAEQRANPSDESVPALRRNGEATAK
jgi:low affinity Fe/Cu permease